MFKNQKSGKICNKFQAIFNSNIIKSINSIITRCGENYEQAKAISISPKLNLSDISLIENFLNTRLVIESGWEIAEVPSWEFSWFIPGN